MKIIQLNAQSKMNILENLLKRSPNQYEEYTNAVNNIIEDVKSRKDEAIFEYTKRFDKADINSGNIRVTEEEFEEAYSLLDPSIVEVIRKAANNIEAYHSKQKQYSWFDSEPDGSLLGQKVTAIGAVGVYVPGGKAAYPSSVLMNVIPAKVAGVERIAMVTPPGKDGKIYEGTLVAAKEAGVTEIYKVGGAQAIAALSLWNRKY
jgi:histidinol dehydrogenase